MAVMATDLEGRITYWNRGSEELYGWRADEVLGRCILDVTPAENATDSAATIMEALRRGESWTGEFLLRRKDGTTFPALVTDSPLFSPDGVLNGIVGVSVDLTARNEAELRLRSESELRALLMQIATEFINVAIDETDRMIDRALERVGTFLDADRLYVFEYRWDEGTAVNTHEWCAPGIEPQKETHPVYSFDRVASLIERHRTGAASLIAGVDSLPEGDPVREILAEQKILSMIAIPMMDGDHCMGAVGLDSVREPRWYSRVEIDLLTVLTTLFTNAVLRRRDQAELHRLLADQEMLLREIHHRVKNNLATISGLLTLQADTAKHPEVRHGLTVVRGQVGAMWRVYERLFHSPDLDSIDLRDFLLDFADDLALSYKSHADRIDLQTSVESIRVRTAVSVPVGLIINELVTNCFKYAFPNDAQGIIRISAARVPDDTRLRNDEVEIVVADNGIGMPDTVSGESTDGFGLKLVESQVQQLRGAMQIDRARGTEFRIRFPLPAI